MKYLAVFVLASMLLALPGCPPAPPKYPDASSP